MVHSLSKRFSDKNLAILLCVLFLISMIPIFYTAAYATPRGDDFSFGLRAHRALEENRGLPGIIQAAWETVVYNYINWQGTFASIFLFALQPGVFGTRFYCVGSWLILLALISATLYLMNAVFCRWLGLPKSWCFLIGIPILISEIQFMPQTFSGIYWFNGASYYTFPYSAMQILLGLMISMECSADRRRVRFALAILIAALLGGGNYVTVLVTLVLLLTTVALSFWKKSVNRWQFVLILAVILTGFAVSAAAPGNLVRGQGALGHRSVVQSVAYSFLCGALLIYHRLRPGVIAVYLFIAPLVLLAARRSKWEFRFPILVLGYGFCVMCTQFTSLLYTGAFLAPPRMECIQFYFMHLWLLFSLFYFCGWLDRRGIVKTDKLVAWWKGHFAFLSTGICVLFLVGAYCWAPQANMRPIASAASFQSMVSGQSKQAYQEFLQLEDCFRTSHGEDLYVSDLHVNPNVTEPLRIAASEDDPNWWISKLIAEYYGCGKILLDIENH